MAHRKLMLMFIADFLTITFAEPQNVAIHRNISALYSCGTFGDEIYYNHTEAVWSSADRVPKTCTSGQFSAEYMVDGLSDTFWQSTSRNRLYASDQLGEENLDTIIEIDLLQEFEVQTVSLHMSDAKRPNLLALYKSIDGSRWSALAYKVTTETECNTKFGVALSSQPVDIDGYICSSYGRPMANQYEQITFDFANVDVDGWKLARYLRLEFYQIHLTLGISGDKFQHYAVSELEVMADCTCNGLESACIRNNVTDRYECVCGGNSQGEYCETCQPLFNQQDYQSDLPCESCQCYEHSESCFYSSTVAGDGQSLNANLEYSGGGVCQNCTDSTAGLNCETCKDFYFRPEHLNQNNSSPCQPCQCELAGIITNPISGLFGDCIVNNDVITPIQLNNQLEVMAPGDCHCKEFVYGTNCDRCLPAYYNLSTENPQGCQECQCYTAGTVNSTNLCDAINGSCTCKPYVDGHLCDECGDKYHSLTQENPRGCSPCQCNPGASISPVCNKTTARCVCKPTVYGRRCESMLDGYYYPDLDSIRLEPEDFTDQFLFNTSLNTYGSGFIQVNTSWSTEYSFPTASDGSLLAGQFLVYMRYQSQSNVSTDTDMAIQSQVLRGSVRHPACPSGWCYSLLVDQVINSTTADETFISISVSNSLLIDSIILLPYEYQNGTKNGIDIEIPAGCELSKRTPDSALSDNCETYIYSMSMLYYGEGFPCQCDSVGSVSSDCTQRGGACPCKPGVGGRVCDHCLPGYYNFTESGCTACDCAGPDQRCDVVTGECACPATTQGHICDQCVDDYWNWSPTGCKSCSCHPGGSTDSQCDLFTGVCHCKPGVGGDKCDSCLPQFYNFTVRGCRECGCNFVGSQDNVCHNDTGQCNCKDNTVGRVCDSCADNSYYYGGDLEKGCFGCDCMGITDRCSSYNQSISQISVSLESSDITSYNLTSVSDAEFRIEGDNSAVASSSDNYLTIQHPAGGNWLLYYGSVLTVTYRPSPILVSNSELRIYLRNQMLSSEIYHQVQISQGVVPQLDVEIRLTEDQWLNKEGNTISRGDLLTILQSVMFVLLPLNLGDNTIRISGLRIVPVPESPYLVEKCQCEPVYIGLSCEDCAFGYTRQPDVNTSLGLCVPCDCNNHAQSCIVETGECLQCQDNTTGFYCEMCVDGYYGDPSQGTDSDCQPCPCYEPGVNFATCDITNSSVVCGDCRQGYVGDLCDKCDDFYWWNGTVCSPCDCNGNSDSCNYTSGECINCINNTTGWYCDICDEGFYGNATVQGCQDCDCDIEGSLHSTCNHETGDCECELYVSGRQCDVCEYAHWGFSDSGCTACDCVASGSLSLQCDMMSGVCDCRQNATGYQCELCSLGSFGLPAQPCQDCACDKVGSLNSSVPCDVSNGTCDCLPGVSGRQCDHCMDMYHNFSSNGCTECGICERKLGSVANTYIDISHQYLLYGDNLLNMIQNHQKLINLTDEVKQDIPYLTESVSTLHQQILSTLTEVSILGESYVVNISAVENSISASLNTSSALSETLQSLYSNLVLLQLSAKDVSAGIVMLEDKINMSEDLELKLSTESADNVEYWSEYWKETEAYDLKSQLQVVARLLEKYEDLANTYKELITNANTTFSDVTNTHSDTSTLNQLVDDLMSDSTILGARIDLMVTDIMNISDYFNTTQILLSYTDQTYQSSLLSLNQSMSRYDQTLELYNKTKGEIPDIHSQLSLLEERNFNFNSSLVDKREELDIYIENFTSTEEKVTAVMEISVNSTSLISNLTMSSLASVRIYDLYRNTSHHVNRSVGLAEDHFDSLTGLSEAANEVRVTQIEISLNATAGELEVVTSDINNIEASRNDAENEVVHINASYRNLSTLWSSLTGNVSQTEVDLLSIQLTAINNTELIGSINDQLDMTENMNEQTSRIHTQISPIMQSYENLGLLLLNTSSGNTNSIANLSIDVANLNDSIIDANQLASQVTNKQADHSERIAQIEDRLSALQARIATAKIWSKQLRQPKKIANNSSSTSNISVTSTEFNELSLEFSLQNHSNQLLLQLSPSTGGGHFEMVVAFVDGALQASLKTQDNTCTLKSRAFICKDCWFTVLISRYDERLSMLVTDLSYQTQPVLDEIDYLNITTRLSNLQVVVGVVPGQSNISSSDWMNFEGCMRSLSINGEDISQAKYAADYAGCCPSLNEPIKSSSVMSLNGFGYAYLKIDQQSDITISFSLRSYSPDGDIISFLNGNASVAVLSLERGRISLQTRHGEKTTTTNYYNYGEWVSVNCLTTNNSLQCEFSAGEVHDTLIASVEDLIVDRTLIGSTVNETDRFSGCIANLTINSELVDAWRDVTEFTGLQPYCYDEVMSGISLKTNSLLTVQPTLIIEPVSHITLDLITRDLSGSLLYMSSDNSTVEISLLQSYLAVVIATAGGFRQGFLYDISLSDYKLHTICVTVHNDSSHTVNIDGALARVMEELEIDSHLMVSVQEQYFVLGDHDRGSLRFSNAVECGITRLVINEWTLPLLTTSIYAGSYNVDLTGIPTTEGGGDPMIPDLITSPLPPTSPRPTCAPPGPAPQYSPTGRRFGDEPVSYATFELLRERVQFNKSAAITVRFRALTSKGLLFYVADSDISPSTWMSLYLENGHLMFNVQANSMRSESIQSNYRYNDGQWWEATLLRLHNFMALVINGRQDYVNNDGHLQDKSQIYLSNVLYVGGIPLEIQNSLPPAVVSESFHGCVDYVSFSSSVSQETVVFNLTMPSSSVGTRQCYIDIQPGVHIADNGYIHAATGVNLTIEGGEMDFSVKVTSNVRSYLLMTIYDERCYLVSYISDSQVNIVLGHFFGGERLVFSSGDAQLSANLCDSVPDHIKIRVSDGVLYLTVSDINYQWQLQFEQRWMLKDADLYVGGSPEDEADFPGGVTTSGLAGCITQIKLDGIQLEPRDFVSSSNTTFGCYN